MKKYFIIVSVIALSMSVVLSNVYAHEQESSQDVHTLSHWYRSEARIEISKVVGRVCARLWERSGVWMPWCDDAPAENPQPMCGDGMVNQPQEECDGEDGVIPGHHCTNQCILEEHEPSEEPEEPGDGMFGMVVINEVYYDVDSPSKGVEGEHEWVELYNPSDTEVDVTGWVLGNRTLPAATIPAFGFAIVTPGTHATSTLSFWCTQCGDINMLLVNGRITASGLSNDGDSLVLKNALDQEVDAMSYGDDTDVFDPAAPDVAEGHSLSRSPNGFDTDSASDWTDLETPTLGM